MRPHFQQNYQKLIEKSIPLNIEHRNTKIINTFFRKEFTFFSFHLQSKSANQSSFWEMNSHQSLLYYYIYTNSVDHLYIHNTIYNTHVVYERAIFSAIALSALHRSKRARICRLFGSHFSTGVRESINWRYSSSDEYGVLNSAVVLLLT